MKRPRERKRGDGEGDGGGRVDACAMPLRLTHVIVCEVQREDESCKEAEEQDVFALDEI